MASPETCLWVGSCGMDSEARRILARARLTEQSNTFTCMPPCFDSSSTGSGAPWGGLQIRGAHVKFVRTSRRGVAEERYLPLVGNNHIEQSFSGIL